MDLLYCWSYIDPRVCQCKHLSSSFSLNTTYLISSEFVQPLASWRMCSEFILLVGWNIGSNVRWQVHSPVSASKHYLHFPSWGMFALFLTYLSTFLCTLQCICSLVNLAFQLVLLNVLKKKNSFFISFPRKNTWKIKL